MLTGVILAGGLSSRMGTNKALLSFGGETLVERQLRFMSPVCARIMLVANDPDLYHRAFKKRLEVIPDLYPGCGPISGLHAALTRSESPIWAVGCDQPFVSAKAALAMRNIGIREGWDAVVPMLEGRPQMLHAIYEPSCAAAFEALIRRQRYRLRDVLEQIRWKPLDEAFFRSRGISVDFSFDMDTPEDYRKGLLAAFSVEAE